MNIIYKGEDKLDKIEQTMLQTLSEEYRVNIDTLVDGLSSIHAEIDTHSTDGNRKKYEITIKARIQNEILRVNFDEWDLSKTIHLAFKKIIKIAKHKYHL